MPPFGDPYWWALGGFFISFVVAGLGAPLPEEILIIGAGVWTATHPEYAAFRWLMLPICIVGVLIADAFLYTFGRYFGSRLLDHRWMRWMMAPHKHERIKKNFHEYGVGILLFGRLLPGVRLPLFLTAGSLHLPIPKFIVADTLGAILGNSILYFLAFWFGDQFRAFVEGIQADLVRYRPLVIMLIIAGVGIYLIVHWLRKPVSEGDPKELPLIGQTIAEHMHSDDRVVSREAVKTNPQPEGNGAEETKPEKAKEEAG